MLAQTMSRHHTLRAFHGSWQKKSLQIYATVPTAPRAAIERSWIGRNFSKAHQNINSRSFGFQCRRNFCFDSGTHAFRQTARTYHMWCVHTSLKNIIRRSTANFSRLLLPFVIQHYTFYLADVGEAMVQKCRVYKPNPGHAYWQYYKEQSKYCVGNCFQKNISVLLARERVVPFFIIV